MRLDHLLSREYAKHVNLLTASGLQGTKDKDPKHLDSRIAFVISITYRFLIDQNIYDSKFESPVFEENMLSLTS